MPEVSLSVATRRVLDTGSSSSGGITDSDSSGGFDSDSTGGGTDSDSTGDRCSVGSTDSYYSSGANTESVRSSDRLGRKCQLSRQQRHQQQQQFIDGVIGRVFCSSVPLSSDVEACCCIVG